MSGFVEGLAAESDHNEVSQSEIPHLSDLYALEVPGEVVEERGRTVERIGDIEKARAIYEKQGQNELGYTGTCGLATIAGLLRMLGVEVTENDIVKYAQENDLCLWRDQPPYFQGATTIPQQRAILAAAGVPTITIDADDGLSLDRVAQAVESGQLVLAGLNAGNLWREEIGGSEGEQAHRNHYQDGQANHAVAVVGVARDVHTHEITGFYINDTGVGSHSLGAGQFISAETMHKALIKDEYGDISGAGLVVSDLPAAATV